MQWIQKPLSEKLRSVFREFITVYSSRKNNMKHSLAKISIKNVLSVYLVDFSITLVHAKIKIFTHFARNK